MVSTLHLNLKMEGNNMLELNLQLFAHKKVGVLLPMDVTHKLNVSVLKHLTVNL